MHQTPMDALPVKPRFLHGCVVVPFENGLIIDGMRQLVVLRGSAATNIVPHLIPFMNGTKTIEEICSSLQRFPVDDLLQAISILADKGLIQEGSSPDGRPEAISNTLEYLRRQVPRRCSNKTGEKLNGRTLVIVVAEPRYNVDLFLQSVLTHSGLGDVRVLKATAIGSLSSLIENPNTLLMSLCLGAADTSWLAALDIACSRNNVPWLRTVIDPINDYADLGPLFINRHTTCYGCFDAVQKQAGISKAYELQSEISKSLLCFWIGIIATEIVYIYSETERHINGSGFRRYRLSDWTLKDLVAFRLPGCISCGTQQPFESNDGQQLIDTSFIYDEYMSLRADTTEGGTAAEMNSGDVGLLPWRTKYMPNARHYILNENKIELGGQSEQRHSIRRADKLVTSDDLSLILKMTAGIDRSRTHVQPKRWCATAGNLGSVELYVVVVRVSGVESGLYYYQAKDHSLARLSRRRNEPSARDFVRMVMQEPGGNASWPDALIIFIGAYHKLRVKYGPFAYRLLNFDAGVAMSQLKHVADEMGLHASDASLRNENEVYAQLYLTSEEEQITGSIALSMFPSNLMSTIHPDMTPNRTVAAPVHSLKKPQTYCGLDVSEITSMLIRESSFNVPGNQAASSAISFNTVGIDESELITLPCPTPESSGSIAAALRLRKSVRDFRSQPILVQTISNILTRATFRFKSILPARAGHYDDLQILVLGLNVTGLRRGMFVYDPLDHKLALKKAMFQEADLRSVYIQPEFASAPVQFFLVSNAAAICARSGVNAYRQMLVMLGESVHVLSTAASIEGLVGTVIAGIRPSGLRNLFGLNGYTKSCLIAFAAGYEQGQ